MWWEEYGFDYILVDEAHEFKNLAIQSTDRAANLTGAEKAEDLLMKIEVLRKRHPGKGVATLATGTPVSNRPSELWAMLRYPGTGPARVGGGVDLRRLVFVVHDQVDEPRTVPPRRRVRPQNKGVGICQRAGVAGDDRHPSRHTHRGQPRPGTPLRSPAVTARTSTPRRLGCSTAGWTLSRNVRWRPRTTRTS